MRFIVFTVAVVVAVPATAREALTGFASDVIDSGDRKYCDTQFLYDTIHSDDENPQDDIERLIAMDGSSQFMSMFLEMTESRFGPELDIASIKVMDCNTNQSFVVDPAYVNYETFGDVIYVSGDKDLTWWMADAIGQAKNLDWEPMDKLSACVCGYLASGDFAKDYAFVKGNPE